MRRNGSSSAWTPRPASTDAGRGTAPNRGTERYPRAVQGRGPLTRPSAGGQAVEFASLGHSSFATKRLPNRIADPGRTWCQNSGGALQPCLRRRSGRVGHLGRRTVVREVAPRAHRPACGAVQALVELARFGGRWLVFTTQRRRVAGAGGRDQSPAPSRIICRC